MPEDFEEEDEGFYENAMNALPKKSRRTVIETMHRRPYYGTKLDRELHDAKNRARANRR